MTRRHSDSDRLVLGVGAAAAMVAGVIIAGANEEASQRNSNSGCEWSPDEATPRSEILVVCRIVAVPAATPLPLIGICGVLAVIVEEHRLRALRTVIHCNDAARPP
jgi:hypothetical protein